MPKTQHGGGDRLDNRGEVLGDFILERELYPVNDTDSPPTFATPNGKSWIDLTLANQKLFPNIDSWNILNETTESDHNYIQINLFNSIRKNTQKLTKKRRTKTYRRPNPRQMD